MDIRRHSFADLLTIENILSVDSVELLQSIAPPHSCCGVTLPENLNELTIGELLRLQQVESNIENLLTIVAEVILGTTKEKLLAEKADKVQGLLNWLTAELKRIGALFSKVGRTPTPEEVQAGYHSLKFGAFGLLDWYAQRQGYCDQNDAAQVPWVRVYQCMKMDNERDAYSRRLSKIMSKKK